ncbi:LCP family protein [Actinomyces urogenitalis]|uniref:LCP family protein n=1 Tax=Actinomyces urogenitalis TaxID=103621 RepID=UPI002900E499|nr:LCP family protein [Actinomyces urogenitalis]MDU0863762.1 LCP family protein [Actinomyces urogenitalis]MDU0874376.1 LCP family protein [Actinomyces urogenitalis]MDU1564405.1 LCP family protein [Actinomyces urogenitalis]MDU1639247.1 LCP family protein [Actinomyces urogenitalis]MDU6777128.1 LCP family protein [Actinomyces urogenitalis]
MTPTDSGDLPPSFAPGSGEPRRSRPRQDDHAQPAPRAGAGAPPPSVPPSFEPARSPRSPQPASTRSRQAGASSRRQSPSSPGSQAGRETSRRQAAGAAAAGGDQASTPSRQDPRSGAPRRPAAGHSHARPGSSAVPLGSAPQAAPQPTRVMPAGSQHAGARPQPASYPAQAPSGPSLPPRAPASGPSPSPDWPAGPRGPVPPQPAPRPARRRRRRHRLRWVAAVLVLALVLVAARVGWLVHAINSGLGRVDALVSSPDTSDGETWLIVGSDARGAGSGTVQDETSGARADSVMVLNKAPNGQTSLISLPRDTYVTIPGYGGNKINASYSFGGAPLLVQTVQDLTGLTVDHYAEVGMGAVEQMVDAVGGVEVCLDYDVFDPDSGLVWDTSQGTCQRVDGTTALAYSRMRKSDPTGDIGRGLRQRAVISAVVSEAASFKTLTSFSRQDALVEAGTHALTVDDKTGTTDLAQMMMAFRSASSAGLTGAPPISSLDYRPGGIGSAVLLQDTTAPDFFAKVRSGELTTADLNQLATG